MNIFFNLIFANSLLYHDPLKEPSFPVVQNQGFTSEISKSYTRLPLRAKEIVNKTVWELSQNSAGLAIYFKTNSSTITISYTYTNQLSLWHMPATGVSGISLLTQTKEGNWGTIQSTFQFQSSKKKVIYKFNDNRKSFNTFKLYLPLYNSIQKLEIIVDDQSQFEWIEKDYSLPIVIYGTSIVQGCCSSTPISAWSNMANNYLNIPILNFGFSGSGKLEERVLNFIIENEASLYVLDCIANLYYYSTDLIQSRVMNCIQLIKKKRPNTPILLVDFVGLNYMELNDAALKMVNNANKAQRSVFEKIGGFDSNLFYLSRDEIGFRFDCWTDYIHPNDLGMKLYAEAFIKKIDEIFKSQKNRLSINIKVNLHSNVKLFDLRYFVYALILLISNLNVIKFCKTKMMFKM